MQGSLTQTWSPRHFTETHIESAQALIPATHVHGSPAWMWFSPGVQSPGPVDTCAETAGRMAVTKIKEPIVAL